MALSGYMFATPAAIAPYLEPPKTGPTARLATALAARLRCYVVAGYPEAIPDAKVTKEVEAEGLGVGYNSAVLAGPEGVIGNYRKTFRFETDKTWAREGDGFAFFDLPEPLGRVGVGICMGA
jgi:protein N-terminal amidase